MKPFISNVLLLAFLSILTLNLYSQTRIWNLKSKENINTLNAELSKFIIRSADKELDKTISTVVDKKTTPPSGDKHDYLSQGRYWWPNPKTVNGLPYIRKDGVVNPEIEDFDRDILSRMVKSVIHLSLAFYLTSDDKYASKAVENLRIWFVHKRTKMNPNMNFGQTIPGFYGGNGRGEGVLDTYGFVEMLDAVELLKKSSSFTKKNQAALNQWFTDYLNWLQTSSIAQEEFKAKNNHGTAFDIQLTRYALFVGKEDIAKQYINEFANRRLFAQIEPTGAQPLELARTTAFGYSVFNLTHFLDMCMIAKSMNIDLLDVKSTDGRSVSKAIDFLTPYVGKQVSDFPYKQIKDWDGVQQKLCWQLYRVDKFTGKNVYKPYYKNISASRDLLYYSILN